MKTFQLTLFCSSILFENDKIANYTLVTLYNPVCQQGRLVRPVSPNLGLLHSRAPWGQRLTGTYFPLNASQALLRTCAKNEALDL